MKKSKWVYDKDNEVVLTEEGHLVFYTDILSCGEAVVKEVVRLHNETEDKWIGSGGVIDEYLLDEGECTQEDRESIVENIFNYLYDSPTKIFHDGETFTLEVIESNIQPPYAAFFNADGTKHLLIDEVSSVKYLKPLRAVDINNTRDKYYVNHETSKIISLC